jgi:hypothetical protein
LIRSDKIEHAQNWEEQKFDKTSKFPSNKRKWYNDDKDSKDEGNSSKKAKLDGNSS